MKYQDFFKLKMQAKRLEETMEGVDDKELEMGITHEMEHTKDEKIARKIAMDHLGDDPHYYSHMKQCGLGEDTGLPKFDDGALKTNRVAGPVVIGKVVNGNGLGKGPADGAVSGYTSVSTTTSHKIGSCSGGNKITAGGTVEPGIAQKSVGGKVVPNAGQKQGGPNTQGNIEGTPKMNGAEQVQVTLFESKSVKKLIKMLVREIYEVMEEEDKLRQTEEPSHEDNLDMDLDMDLDLEVEPTDHVEEIPSVDTPTTIPIVDPEVEAKRREKVPGCKFCADKDVDKFPPHWPAEGCKNPHKRTHCTCPVCFP
jgi:hypothetical protein